MSDTLSPLTRSILDRCTGDGGHLRVPCSRYGSTGEDVAPYAAALAYVFADANGEDPLDGDLLDGFMSAVVNDHGDPADLLVECWHAVPVELRRMLGGLREVRKLRD